MLGNTVLLLLNSLIVSDATKRLTVGINLRQDLNPEVKKKGNTHLALGAAQLVFSGLSLSSLMSDN